MVEVMREALALDERNTTSDLTYEQGVALPSVNLLQEIGYVGIVEIDSQTPTEALIEGLKEWYGEDRVFVKSAFGCVQGAPLPLEEADSALEELSELDGDNLLILHDIEYKADNTGGRGTPDIHQYLSEIALKHASKKARVEGLPIIITIGAGNKSDLPAHGDFKPNKQLGLAALIDVRVGLLADGTSSAVLL